MKRMVDSFKVVAGRNTLDEFTYYVDSNNHATINNGSNCLFDGYALEAGDRWAQICADMKMLESAGIASIVHSK